MKLRFAGMTAGLALGVTAAVFVASTAGAYLYSTHHFETLLGDARRSALAEGDLIRVALEHQMMENDRSLIARMVESFGKEPRVSGVMLLDLHHPVRLLKELSPRKHMMEEMGAAYTANGIITLAGSRMYTSMADTDGVIDDALERFERVLSNVSPA